MTLTTQTKLRRELGGVISDRPLQSGFILVPADFEVRLKSGFLAWRSRIAEGERDFRMQVPAYHAAIHPSQRFRPERPGVGFLAAFMQLHGATDRNILAFAKRWGVLDIGAEGFDRFVIKSPTMPTGKNGDHLEPLSSWRQLSARCNAIANIAAELNQDRPGRPEDYNHAGTFLLDTYSAMLRDKNRRHGTNAEVVEQMRTSIAIQLNTWLFVGATAVRMVWIDDRSQWQIGLVADKMFNAFGVLAMKLMFAVSEKDGLAICSSCHRSYLPPRRPDPTRRNYCPDCGIRAAWRDGARDARERQRTAVRKKR